MPRARLTFALLFLLAGQPAPATTLQRMSLEELAASAPAIARVKILSSEARIESGRIWTFTQVEVQETFKGSLSPRVTLRLLGGKAGALVSKVEGVPRFAPGEEAILFLQPTRLGDWSVVSWAQGTFRIAPAGAAGHELVTQDTAGVALFDPATRCFANGETRHLALPDFQARLAQAIARAERKTQ